MLALRHYSYDTFATDTELLSFYNMFFRYQLAPDGSVEGMRLPLDQWEEGVLFTRVSGG